MKIAWTFVLITLLGLNGYAHEGDHGPSTFQPQKGGVVRSLETVHLELLMENSDIKIFAFEIDGKPSAVSKYPASLKIERPRAKPETVKLTSMDSHWMASFDPKGAHRITIFFEIEQGGHKDTVKWTIEPKKRK